MATTTWALEAARLLAHWRDGGGGPLLHLTAGEARAEAIARFARQALPETRAEALPPWDCLPYDWASPSARAMGRRMAVLRALADAAEAPRLVVATPAAALQRLPPVGAARALTVRVGGPLDPEALRAFCEAVGYRVDDRVDEPGEVALRGGVADLFDAASDWPARIEFRELVTAIRRYDPATQRSVEELAELVIDAASELPGPAAEGEEARGAEHRLDEAYAGALATILDHMPGARLTFTSEAERARGQAHAQVEEAHRERAQAGPGRVPPPERLHVGAADWTALAARHGAEELDLAGAEPVPAFAEAPRPRAALREFLAAQGNRRVSAVARPGGGQARLARRLREVVGEAPDPVADWDALRASDPGAVLSLAAGIDEGFVDLRDGVVALAPRDVLGSRAVGARDDGAGAAPWTAEAAELHEGDLVVHLEHGVGRLAGLEPAPGEAPEGEAIRLDYAEGQSLLVPAAEAGRLWRYGSDEGAVALDRLDGSGWARRRARIAEGLAETARGLVAAAEARNARAAPKLVPDRAPYERLAARFPYEETPDQARAIAAVLGDLASGRPMDRLVIGDVGFGKTEVAIRAAAAAAFAGRQVAVLAPTTVLARQHARGFARRFAGLGLEVAQLSRLAAGAEAKRVKAGLKDGSIRIVVGTQALLGRGVDFADLALAVVDEEQRLGRADKERLRARLGDGHLLTMTATPIPRTLQSALVGLQDLSVIATLPARRRPIRTLVAPRDPATLRQAILRERRRGGQSFVVVPRVEDVDDTAAMLRGLLPGLSVRVAHGRLPAREIDEVMVGFAEGEGDVLLATSIIESGLDVPRANTMVVLRPELFGLAQLHQLRGRVGRGGAQSSCYLMTEPGTELPPATLRRLGTLQALDRLGAGLALSAQDLDQRGGGELFGERQSGHVRLIGLPLYQELLADALRAARGDGRERPEVELRIAAAGTLPESYVPEAELRVNLYHRIARCRDEADAARVAEEIADRFGPPPPPVVALLDAARLRAMAAARGVVRVSAGPEAVALDVAPGAALEARHAEAAEAAGYEWVEERLVWRRASAPEARLGLALEMLEELG